MEKEAGVDGRIGRVGLEARAGEQDGEDGEGGCICGLEAIDDVRKIECWVRAAS